MERRLAAILAADVMGYSRHTERNEEASTVTLRMYRAVLEEAISAHRGRIFSSAGDGVVAEFPSIVEAIRCAIEIQNEIAERNASVPERDRMQFRIGVNLGDVIAEDNNLYGTGVNVAVRLEQLADPGGICVSQTVYDQVRKIVEIPFEDIGEQRLKNISDPIHVYRVLPGPLPWLRGLISRASIRRGRLGVVTLLLLLAATAGALYLGQPDRGQPVPHPEKPIIAVLPFDDRYPEDKKVEDPDAKKYAYLSDGIAEELRINLGRNPDLRLIGRDSSKRYIGKTTAEMKKDLNVRYVVTGSIDTSSIPDNIHVTANLTDANTAIDLWSHIYDEKLEGFSIAIIRDHITESIAAELGGLTGQFARAELGLVAAKDPAEFRAYDYLLQGWQAWRQFTKDSNQTARELFEKARNQDPNYARAYVGLMWTYAIDYDFWCTTQYDFDNAKKRALDSAEEAVRLNPKDYQSWWALGWARLYNGQHAQAEDSYNKALELNPYDPELLAERANFLIYMGRPKEAIEQIKESKRLNPKPETWVNQYLGWAYEEAGMPEEAIEELVSPIVDQENRLPVDQENPTEFDRWVLPTLAAAYAEVGRMDDANRIREVLKSHWPEFSTEFYANLAPYAETNLRNRYKKVLYLAGMPE